MSGCGNPTCSPPAPKPKRSDRVRGSTRTSTASISRSPLFLDNAALNAMVSNLENFGQSYEQYAQQRAFERYGTGRVPLPQSTPQRGYGQLTNESFGSPTDFQDILDPMRTSQTRDGSHHSGPLGAFLLSDQNLTPDPEDPNVSKERQESLIEWFDRSMELELNKRKEPEDIFKKKRSPPSTLESSRSPHNVRKSPITDRLSEANASAVEIVGDLLTQPDSELAQAAESLYKAQAMCTFAGAVDAAEEAAKNAPAEHAEEAAAAGAREFEAEITNVVKEVLPGDRPIEVVGYVGITKPKFPAKTPDLI